MDERINIRKTVFEDKLAVQAAHQRSIREICSKDYEPAVIEAWSDVNYDDERFRNSIENDHHLVVVLDGQIEGVCHSTVHQNGTGEVVGLYLAPAVIGLGAGRAVFEKALNYLRENKVSKITISGTRTAKGFYEKMGFSAVGEEKLHEIRGAKIGCFPMEMKVEQE